MQKLQRYVNARRLFDASSQRLLLQPNLKNAIISKAIAKIASNWYSTWVQIIYRMAPRNPKMNALFHRLKINKHTEAALHKV